MSRRHFLLTTLASLAALSGCQKAGDAASASSVPPGASGQASAVVATASAAAEAMADVQDAYLLAATGSGFSTGPTMSARTVYVFFDTSCPHCAHLWQAAQSLGNQLKIVWIPVGFLRPQSMPQGATILAASDPVAMMNENEASVANHGRGISVPATVDDEALMKVRANTSLFKQFQSDSVPLIVFRNAKTGEVGQHAGAVSGPELLALASV
ncbi:thioredoxin fold domain-containing protein [Ideonella sp. DXS29W]|uniref:Thioredoxin fold domain-containing protein n=1 Tax=Ideonella lacteola TaxID=2984193 RepID=A0ABU9BPA7_9BURK